MKNLLFLLMTLYAGAFRAQEVFTLKGAFGFNGCQIHGDSYSGYDKFGFLAGPAVNARLGESSSLELGFYFSQKGSRHNPDHKRGDYTFYRIHLNYIDMPLMLRFSINEKYFVTLGPSLAYLISYSEQNEFGDWTGTNPFNKTEVGLNFGIGGTIKEKWTVELRSCNSITPIRGYGGLTSKVYYPNAIARAFNQGLYNNILSLFLSYKFDLAKKWRQVNRSWRSP